MGVEDREWFQEGRWKRLGLEDDKPRRRRKKVRLHWTLQVVAWLLVAVLLSALYRAVEAL